ncbi:MAG: VOC family protein [Pseudomonadota bacterium]
MITGFDHIVLCVKDVSRTVEFYTDHLGMVAKEERPGKWALHFGDQKISLQDADHAPAMAKNTTVGSGNFCLICAAPVEGVAERLTANGIEIIEGPAERLGATGKILSIYFRDPDGNLVEVCNSL